MVVVEACVVVVGTCVVVVGACEGEVGAFVIVVEAGVFVVGACVVVVGACVDGALPLLQSQVGHPLVGSVHILNGHLDISSLGQLVPPCPVPI